MYVMLRGYAVLTNRNTEDKEPHCIVRIDLDPNEDKATHTIIEGHENYHLARYYATMLNEGKHDEEWVKAQIAQSRNTK